MSIKGSNRWRQVLLLILGLALTGLIDPMAYAQQDVASVEGVVRDETGAVIPGATVTIRSDALNLERSAVASGEGVYSILQLRPSGYRMTIRAQGFAEVKMQVRGWVPLARQWVPTGVVRART